MDCGLASEVQEITGHMGHLRPGRERLARNPAPKTPWSGDGHSRLSVCWIACILGLFGQVRVTFTNAVGRPSEELIDDPQVSAWTP